MIAPEEIVDLAEFLKRKDFQTSPEQLFAAQQVLRSEWGQDTGPTSFVRLSNAIGPIFCRTAEEQQQFASLYLQWLRQRSGQPKTRSTRKGSTAPTSPEMPTVHWRMKVAAMGLLILPMLTAWFLGHDLRPREVVGQVKAEGQPLAGATVRLGELPQERTDGDGQFHVTFQAKDVPLELSVESEGFLTSKTPVGESIKRNRNWFYFSPINFNNVLDSGTIQLTREEHETTSTEPLPPDSSSPDAPPAELTIEKLRVLKVPPPSWATRLDGWKAIGALLPLLLALAWLAYRKWRRPSLQRQSSRIPPELTRVQVHTGTQQIFPSLSLRHLTQRLRQTRFVESAELDVARTIQHTMAHAGLFTPVFGSRREPGYVALIDRATLADHQAHLATHVVKDLARGYVLVRQYEFDEQPTMLQRVDPLRPTRSSVEEGTPAPIALEVTPLEELVAKFPARRLLCFGDPNLCFHPLTGKWRPWIETLEGWEERYWVSANPERSWGQAERLLSRRGFQVFPFSHLGLQALARRLDEGRLSHSRASAGRREGKRLFERMPERWLERHPPSQESTTTLLNDLTGELGVDGMRWLAACAAYPEIHWALTLEWSIRLFKDASIAETLLPKLTRLVWFRQAFMPDWFRQALYDRLTPEEAEQISQELGEILSAVNPEQSDGLVLTIATRSGKTKPAPRPKRSLKSWFESLRRKLTLQAMGQVAEAGSPLRDYVLLQYLSGKQGKTTALTTYAPKALLRALFPNGQPWLGFRPFTLLAAAVLATGGLWDWFDPIPVPLPSPITAMALSSDGQMLGIGLKDGRVVEWDRASQRITQTYEFYPSSVTSMAVSPDGNFLAAGYQDGTIHILDKNVGTETKVLKNDDKPVTSLAFWPTRNKLPRMIARSSAGKVSVRDFNL